jgi:hypothetical protein
VLAPAVRELRYRGSNLDLVHAMTTSGTVTAVVTDVANVMKMQFQVASLRLRFGAQVAQAHWQPGTV